MDEAVFQFLNGYAGSSEARDMVIRAFSLNPLVKTLPIIAVFWYLWFKRSGSTDGTGAKIIATFVLGTLSIAVGRVLALVMPHSLRPMHQDAVPYQLPLGMEPGVLSDWSSMPSDHAVFNFTLAACLFAVHRGFGIWALLHVAIIICLPRIYLGLHWPSDILVGALVGLAIARMALPPMTGLMRRIGVVRWAERAQPAFYVILLLLSFQLATNFNSLRQLFGSLRDGLNMLG